MCMNDELIGDRNIKNNKEPQHDSQNGNYHEINDRKRGMMFQHSHIKRIKTALR